ncbi:MAG: DUF5671 domain-containing protein [Chloroflexales bacterium]
MTTVRRWYIFVTATIGLHGLAWALIALLRGILGIDGQSPVATTAFQIALVLVALPLWLVHWLWAERLAHADGDERASALRRLYLYGNLAGLLLPLSLNVWDMLLALLRLGLGLPQIGLDRTPGQALLRGLTALLVLGGLYAYHALVARDDVRAAPPTGAGALVRRIYLLGVAAVGVATLSTGATSLLRWLLFQIGGTGDRGGLAAPVAAVLVGLALWLGHWLRAEQLFAGADADERASALRKFYLYALIVVGALSLVVNAAALLAGMLRVAFGLTPEGDIRDALPTILIGGVVWGFHAKVLRTDVAALGEAPRQAGVRRLAWYLVATIGLAASLIGLGGLLSVLIRALGGSAPLASLRDPLAWFIATLIAGLPPWLVFWRRAQVAATTDGPVGEAERTSPTRRIYLFFFVFVATLTVLGGLLYILYRLISIALGEPFAGDLVTDLAQAIAYSLIAVGVLLAHGATLRRDGRTRQATNVARQAALRVLVLADGETGAALLVGLRGALPGLGLTPLDRSADLASQLAQADLVVGPWAPGGAGDPLAGALAASPARKLLLPLPGPSWDWAGVEAYDVTAGVGQIVAAVRHALAAEPIRPQRPLGAGTIIGAAIGVLLLLLLLFSVLQLALFAMGVAS